MAYVVSPRVQRIIAAENISPSELQEMLRLAAPYTGPEGFNRRFHRWSFRVGLSRTTAGYEVEDMQSVDLKSIGLPGSYGHMEEPCEACDGEGCKACGWRGQVIRNL